MTSIRKWTKPRLLAARALWKRRLVAAENALDKLRGIRTALVPRTKLTPQRKIERLHELEDRVSTCRRMIDAYDAELARRSPARIDDWLTGNVVPITKVPRLLRRRYRRMLLAAADAARAIGRKLECSSTFRFRADQERVWRKFLAGGPLAARPGTSPHEKGMAIDFPNAEGGLRNDEQAADALRARGFRDDVPSEDWHFTFYG